MGKLWISFPLQVSARDTDEDTPPQLDFLLGGTAAGVGPIHGEEMPRSRSREPESREPMKSSGYSGGAFDRAMASSGRAWGDRGPATSPKPQAFDISSHNSGGESALLAIVQEMRKQREQDAKETAEQLKSLKGEKSVFTYSLRDDLRVLGDGDADLGKHLEAFQDVCLLRYDREGCQAQRGLYEAKPSAVFDRVIVALDASFHESDEAKAMKARAKYDNLEKKSTAFQQFQVSWLEALTELNAAGVYKCQKYLLYDYLHKIGSSSAKKFRETCVSGRCDPLQVSSRSSEVRKTGLKPRLWRERSRFERMLTRRERRTCHSMPGGLTLCSRVMESVPG